MKADFPGASQPARQAVVPWPDTEMLRAWLRSPEVVHARGPVRSWVGPDGTAYDYPEAAGLWLSFYCGDPREARHDRAVPDAVAAWLAGLADRGSGVGREGRRYVFDSAMALAGLIEHAAAYDTRRHEGAMRRLFAFVAEGIEASRGCDPVPPVDGDRWSTCFGSHLLKVAIALLRFDDRFGAPAATRLVERLCERLVPLFDGQRFVTCAGSSSSYLHGALYALEGLAWLDHRGTGDFEASLVAAVAWLATVQDLDGGLRPFVGPEGCYGEPRGDVAAQAVRLWTLVDAARYEANIAAALRFLGELQDSSGGIRYSRDSRDVNVWVSLFAAQALAWVSAGADPARLF